VLTTLTYSPSTCPITSALIIQHSRIDNSADANLVALYANVATEMVESYLSRFLINRSVTWTVAESGHHHQHHRDVFLSPWPWSSFIRNPLVTLPRPASAVASVVLGVWGASDVTLTAGTDYVVDVTSPCGRIKWLTTAFQNSLKDHLQVTFTSGYGVDLTTVPTSIQMAIMLLTTALYENRGDTSPVVWSSAIESLLAPHRFTYFG
jgi:uncharacterized phiE125 gp8 family phage protein